MSCVEGNAPAVSVVRPADENAPAGQVGTIIETPDGLAVETSDGLVSLTPEQAKDYTVGDSVAIQRSAPKKSELSKQSISRENKNSTAGEEDDDGIYDKQQKLSVAEKAACGRYLPSCNASRKAGDADIAATESEAAFPRHEDVDYDHRALDNRADAARHCIWTGLMIESSDEPFARDMAAAHEDGAGGGNGTAAGEMDVHNNETGFNVGRNSSGMPNRREYIVNECTRLAREAELVSPDNVPPPDGETLVILVDNTY